jgi:hypothetical protein
MKNDTFRLLVILTVILSVISLVVSLISAIDSNSYSVNDRYTLYIGTSSQDTAEPEMPLEEAENLVTEIAFKYADGFTLYNAKGGWISEGVRYDENTLVYVFVGIERETAELIAAEACVALNQSSVLIEYSKTHSLYLAAD